MQDEYVDVYLRSDTYLGCCKTPSISAIYKHLLTGHTILYIHIISLDTILFVGGRAGEQDDHISPRRSLRLSPTFSLAAVDQIGVVDVKLGQLICNSGNCV